MWLVMDVGDPDDRPERVARQIRIGETYEDEYQRACDMGMFVGGETVRIGTARGSYGDELDALEVSWIEYREAPQVFDEEAES